MNYFIFKYMHFFITCFVFYDFDFFIYIDIYNFFSRFYQWDVILKILILGFSPSLIITVSYWAASTPSFSLINKMTFERETNDAFSSSMTVSPTHIFFNYWTVITFNIFIFCLILVIQTISSLSIIICTLECCVW